MNAIPSYEFVADVECEGTYNCFDAEGNIVAWITTRPGYCDRGHYQGQVDVPNQDFGDAWPNYYMRLDRAMEEMRDFLLWRLHRIRCRQKIHARHPYCMESHTGQLIPWMHGDIHYHACLECASVIMQRMVNNLKGD